MCSFWDKEKTSPFGEVFLAQKEGFEPSHALYTSTPLAGEPLRPLGYFCMMPLKYDSIVRRDCQEI